VLALLSRLSCLILSSSDLGKSSDHPRILSTRYTDAVLDFYYLYGNVSYVVVDNLINPTRLTKEADAAKPEARFSSVVRCHAIFSLTGNRQVLAKEAHGRVPVLSQYTEI